MSDIPSDWREQLDLRSELARIDRDQAEIHKLTAEAMKLLAERNKLRMDRWIAPVIALATLIGALGITRWLGH